MNRTVYKMEFSDELPIGMVDFHLITAARATESLYGRGAVRLDAATTVNERKRIVTIDAETEVGVDMAKIFMGFMSADYGDKSFRVTKTEEYLRSTDEELMSRMLL